MIKLVESGLFGDGLIEIRKPMMVKRYNLCLEEIGLKPTKLKTFHIDGWGWSPEIAEEQSDRFYLSHGLANPYAIILTPEQKDSPLYMPYHSFDWDIHRQVFENYLLQIQDITSEYGIWLELDQNISAYRNAQDLLMMEVVNVHFHVAGDIQAAAIYQKALVKTFSEEPMAWMDKELLNKIIASSKLHGDLRYRNMELPPFPHSNLSAYYTLAYGGLYVFKNPNWKRPMLIFEDNSSEVSNSNRGARAEYNLEDKRFMPFLFNKGLLSTDSDYFRERLFLLEHQLEFRFLKAAMKVDPEAAVDEMNKHQRKGILHSMIQQELLDDSYFALERIIHQLRQKDAAEVETKGLLNEALLHPAASASMHEKQILWQLLDKSHLHNPLITYIFNKSAFYQEYQQWEPPIQRWVIRSIVEHPDLYRRLIS